MVGTVRYAPTTGHHMDAHYDDPRITGEHLRSIDTPTGTVTLVGVVHDHPASAFRVRTVVTDRDPDHPCARTAAALAPFFRAVCRGYSHSAGVRRRASAAIQASSTADHVVGIDGPTLPFLRRLAATLYHEGGSIETVRGVFDGLVSVTKNTLRCRLAGSLAAMTSIRLEVDSPVTYAIDRVDSPGRQAENERHQIARARAVMDAFEPLGRLRSVTTCARRTWPTASPFRDDGDVVAVVGRHHLDSVAEQLDALLGEADR